MIELPSILFYPPLICGLILVLIIVAYKRTYKSRYRKFWISFSQFLIVYSLIVGSAALTEMKIKNELIRIEQNKSSYYSEEEAKTLYQAAMDRLINDVGRNSSIFTGLIISGIFSLTTYSIIWGLEKYKKLKEEEITTNNFVYKK
jgi:glucan phosphoethanolaminetransferase (alkaline phosphatase superfamily)